MRLPETDTGQICINGHVVNGYTTGCPEFNKDSCPICDAPTITACLHCDTKIPGSANSLSGFRLRNAPATCHACGESHPWTIAADSAREMIAKLDGLHYGDKQFLIGSIETLMCSSPESEAVAVRLKKMLTKTDRQAECTLRVVLSDLASERARKILLTLVCVLNSLWIFEVGELAEVLL